MFNAIFAFPRQSLSLASAVVYCESALQPGKVVSLIGPCRRLFRQGIDAVRARLVDHGKSVLDRDVVLQAVGRAQQVSPAFAHFPDPLADFLPHILGLAPRQGFLNVDAAIEEHFICKHDLLRPGARVSSDLGRQAVIAIDALLSVARLPAYEAAHERQRYGTAAVELDFSQWILLEVIVLRRDASAVVVRDKLLLEHLQGKE